MTNQKLFKRRVRERMSKTGEHYTIARGHINRARERDDTIDLSSAMEIASDTKLSEATGRGWQDWTVLLDRWGARTQTHPDTVTWLKAEHGVPGWWAQTITVGYQRTRGMRLKHQQAHGFTVYASKTYPRPLQTVFQAFVDADVRAGWLADGPMRLRSSQPGKVARFDWGDDGTRVMVTFEAKGPAKATAYVSHERLPDPAAGDAAKAAWKDRLAELAAHLASTDV